MILVYIYTYLPRILENSMVRQNHFQIEDILKQPMGKRKKPFQIEDIHDICDYLWFFTHMNPEFSKHHGAMNHS